MTIRRNSMASIRGVLLLSCGAISLGNVTAFQALGVDKRMAMMDPGNRQGGNSNVIIPLVGHSFSSLFALSSDGEKTTATSGVETIEEEDLESLMEEKKKQEETLKELQGKMIELNYEIASKSELLSQSQTGWETEKKSLMDKITELSSLLKPSEDREELEEIDLDVERARQKELAKEVELMQDQMVVLQNQYRTEQRKVEELSAQLDRTSDAYESEQMVLQKQRAELQDRLDDQRKQLERIQGAWTKEQAQFSKTKQNLEMQIQREKKRLEDDEEIWVRTQQNFENRRKDLQGQLKEQQDLCKELQQTLRQTQDNFAKQREELREAIQVEQEKLMNVQKKLRIEQSAFRKLKTELEQKIGNEQAQVKKLEQTLQSEQVRFDAEKRDLERRISLESLKCTTVEQQLQEEKELFLRERANMDEKLSDSERVRKLKRGFMRRRYQQIRKELVARLQGVEKANQKEQEWIAKRYAKKIAVFDQGIQDLQAQVQQAEVSTEEMSKLSEEMYRQRDEAISKRNELESRYIRIMADRNTEIKTLQTNLTSLKATIQAREAKLNQYRSSYRELGKLAMKLTGKRVKAGRKRFFGKKSV